jgi:ankyrin repeat protein
MARLLIENGADVDSKDKRGRTPLWDARDGRHEYAARLLIKNGAKVNSEDKKGYTPLLASVT